MTGNDDEALKNFEKVLAAHPNFIQAEYGKRLVYISLLRQEDAIVSLEKYVANDLSSEQQFIQLAQQFLMELKWQNQSTNLQ